MVSQPSAQGWQLCVKKALSFGWIIDVVQHRHEHRRVESLVGEAQRTLLSATLEQVKAALGEPLKTVNLGTKQILVYKDLKVTLLKGKVTDVE